MSNPNNAQANPSRGTILAILAIPAAFLLSALASGFIGPFAAITVGAAGVMTTGLWQRGARTMLMPKHAGSYLIVAIPAALAGILGIVLGSIYQAFKAVGGPGTPFGVQYWNAVAYRFSNGFDGEQLLWFAVALAIGIGGIVAALRAGPKQVAALAAQEATAAASRQKIEEAEAAYEASLKPGATETVTPLPRTPEEAADAARNAAIRAEEVAREAARRATPPISTSNTSSSGIILNGKPYDPNAKK